MALTEAGLLVPFFQHLAQDMPDEDLATAMSGLSLEIKLRVLQPLLTSLSPEEWQVIGQLMGSVQGGE
jgi:hypothetical protein